MDEPSREHTGQVDEIRIEPRLQGPVPPPPRTRSPRLPLILGTLGFLAGMGALGWGYWTSQANDREVLRLSTELAQLRVSLDLYARNATPAPGPGAEELAELSERLTALENQPAIVEPATTLPPLPASAEAQASPQGEDCLPAGMRLLVAMGDNYSICGQEGAVVEVATIDNGYISLADGTTIPSGGTMPLPNSTCTIGVTSGGDEGLTGYAEIRVSC